MQTPQLIPVPCFFLQWVLVLENPQSCSCTLSHNPGIPWSLTTWGNLPAPMCLPWFSHIHIGCVDAIALSVGWQEQIWVEGVQSDSPCLPFIGSWIPGPHVYLKDFWRESNWKKEPLLFSARPTQNDHATLLPALWITLMYIPPTKGLTQKVLFLPFSILFPAECLPSSWREG